MRRKKFFFFFRLCKKKTNCNYYVMSDYFLPDVQSCPSLCVETTPGTTPASMEGTALRESCPVTVHLDSLDTGRTGDLVYQYWTLVLFHIYTHTHTYAYIYTIYYPYFYYFLSIQLSQIKWRFQRFKEISLRRLSVNQVTEIRRTVSSEAISLWVFL